jgi:hypothetical protein
LDESWKVIATRGTKRRRESKIKLRENELTHSKKQTAVTANRYAVPETDTNTHRNGNRRKTVYGNKLRAINNEQKEK